MNKENKKTHGGFYFIWGVICAVLVCLKITHVINWSWALVLLPFYVPAAIIVIVIIAAAAVIIAKEYDDQ